MLAHFYSARSIFAFVSHSVIEHIQNNMRHLLVGSTSETETHTVNFVNDSSVLLRDF